MCPQLLDAQLFAELIAELMLLSKESLFFHFNLLFDLCYVMLPTSSSLSLTPLTYLAGR